MDDIIALFEKPEHLQQFAAYINKLFSNIRVSVEAEKNGALPFLDIKIYRKMGNLLSLSTGKKLSLVWTSLVYHTPIFIDVFN